jgi:PEP-CTERM motif
MTRPTTLVLGLALLATPAQSRADYFYGLDAGAGPTSSLPNSSHALSLFQAAVAPSTETLINFENLSPVNSPTTDNTWFSLGHNFEVETLNTDHTTPPPGFQYGLTNTPNSNTTVNNNLFGFSTSGTQHFEFVPAAGLGPTSSTSVTFQTTGAGFQAFGFYITGLGDQPETLQLTFQDKTLQKQLITGSSQGGALFVGVTGDGTLIKSFTLTMTGFQTGKRDAFGIDDIRLASIVVPEPSSLVLTGLGVGLGGCWFARRTRRKWL